jgi:rhodanese-related sulfurtransferase
VPGAISAPLGELERRLGGASGPVDLARPTAVICAGGYRSSAATGILLRHGARDLRNVLGGTGAWVDAGYPVEVPAGVSR